MARVASNCDCGGIQAVVIEGYSRALRVSVCFRVEGAVESLATSLSQGRSCSARSNLSVEDGVNCQGRGSFTPPANPLERLRTSGEDEVIL